MNVSKVYKLTPLDMEQMSIESIQNFIYELRISLNQFSVKRDELDFKRSASISNFLSFNYQSSKEEYYFKIYSLADELYLNTNFEGKLSIPNTTLIDKTDTNDINKFLIDDGVAHSDAVLGDDFVKINGRYLRLINLYEFPKNIMPSSLMDFGNFCLSFKKLDPGASKRRVNTQRKLHHSNLYSNLRNIESEASYIEAEKITMAMMEGTELLFDVEGWFILKADTLQELSSSTKELVEALKQAEIVPFIEAEGLDELFLSILSGVKPSFKRAHQTPTSVLANMIPLKHDQLHEKGIEFYSLRGNSLKFDLFNESTLNFNVLLSGQSGAGKSMIAQEILVNELANGTSAIVLDLGNSFKKTAQYYGGTSLSCSFNPLQFKNLHYLKELIISVIPANELNAKLEGKIFSLIEEYIEATNSFKDLIIMIADHIPDFELYFVELWEFFDTEERELSNFTYVDTSLFPDKIKAPLIIYLIECFKNLEGKKIFIFDEVWSFLRNNAEYLAECFRTFRKFGASAISISQGIDDFSTTELGQVIAKLCSTKILFQQSIEVSTEIDEFDIEKIKQLSTKKGSYSEFYIKTENFRKTARFYTTPLKYELFTSYHADRESFERFHDQNSAYFLFPTVVDRYIDFKYNFGGIHA
jgi:hypothetical protein